MSMPRGLGSGNTTESVISGLYILPSPAIPCSGIAGRSRGMTWRRGASTQGPESAGENLQRKGKGAGNNSPEESVLNTGQNILLQETDFYFHIFPRKTRFYKLPSRTSAAAPVSEAGVESRKRNSGARTARETERFFRSKQGALWDTRSVLRVLSIYIMGSWWPAKGVSWPEKMLKGQHLSPTCFLLDLAQHVEQGRLHPVAVQGMLSAKKT